MSKFIQTHFFYPSTFSLSTKQKGEKIKSFLSSHFFIPSTKRTFRMCLFGGEIRWMENFGKKIGSINECPKNIVLGISF